MPVSVPSLEDLAALQEQFNMLKAKVEAMELPQNVKDALLVVLKWMIGELSDA